MREKCVFMQDEICYLGFKIGKKEGFSPISEKLELAFTLITLH